MRAIKNILMGNISFILAISLVVGMGFIPEVSKAGEIKLSGWGTSLFVPGMGPDDESTVPRDDSRWGGPTRIGFNVDGVSDNIGFHADINVDMGVLGVSDHGFLWAKPFKDVGLEIKSGWGILHDALRGNSAFGSWNWLRPTDIVGEDNIFKRGRAGRAEWWAEQLDYVAPWEGNQPAGGFIAAYDASGLHVFAALTTIEGSVDLGTDENGEPVEEQYTTSLMLQRGQYAAGYKIDGVGLIRAQLDGRAYQKEKTATEKEMIDYYLTNVAFRLEAVKNLYLDIGISSATDSAEECPDKGNQAVYGNYKIDKATVHFLADLANKRTNAEGDEGTGMHLGVGVDYDLGEGVVFTSDLRSSDTYWTGRDSSTMSFMLGVNKYLSNGVVGIAFQQTTGQFVGGDVVKEEGSEDAAIWALPIKIEYWF